MGRWDELFDDLEGRWAEEERAQELGSVPDRVRRDRGSTTILGRALAAEGRSLQAVLPGGEMLHGVLTDAGAGWLRLEADDRAQVVRTDAVRHLAGLPRAARPGGRVADRPVGAAVRDLARDRRAVRVHLTAGEVLEGMVQAVGHDHVDLALVPADVPARRGVAARLVTVPLDGIAAIRQV
ncbi:hypothetical protein [Arsenicicoccus dermatophilus]|uniref:hypothetical protein n=1 Tax=Arsenicicoccus dermatophilus TaxID=1076331 RepID=UPI003916D051